MISFVLASPPPPGGGGGGPGSPNPAFAGPGYGGGDRYLYLRCECLDRYDRYDPNRRCDVWRCENTYYRR